MCRNAPTLFRLSSMIVTSISLCSTKSTASNIRGLELRITRKNCGVHLIKNWNLLTGRKVRPRWRKLTIWRRLKTLMNRLTLSKRSAKSSKGEESTEATSWINRSILKFHKESLETQRNQIWCHLNRTILPVWKMIMTKKVISLMILRPCCLRKRQLMTSNLL